VPRWYYLVIVFSCNVLVLTRSKAFGCVNLRTKASYWDVTWERRVLPETSSLKGMQQIAIHGG